MSTGDPKDDIILKARGAIEAAQATIAEQKEQIDKLTTPPNGYGIVIRLNEDDLTVDVRKGGMILKLEAPDGPFSIEVGDEVVLNEHNNIIAVSRRRVTGDVVSVKEIIPLDRVIVETEHGENVVSQVAFGCHILKVGDRVRRDAAGLVTEKLPRSTVDELLLEEVPNVSYSDIGGLSGQIEEITDAVELPLLHAALFSRYELPPTKGVLLYGPPGCGKTMIAKAVARSIADKMGSDKSFFINVKGPELLNKYVGETERQIRAIFQAARERGEEHPVVIFFDEMESLFRTRGSGVSSDMESTVVPQLLAELDGVDALKNVIVIGATNRQDLIDPAVLRPGRLDVKIRVERPDMEAAADIFSKYLHDSIPVAVPAKVLVSLAVDELFRTDSATEFLEVTYQKGDRETLYFKDFVSGAMVESIVSRAKKSAIKREISSLFSKGITESDILEAIKQEFRENEDLPNTTNPDDWARISGKKGDRIINVRPLVSNDDDTVRVIDNTPVGTYL